MIQVRTIEVLGSRVWKIRPHPLYAAKELAIRWAGFLPPRSTETAHERAYLRQSTKQYFLEWIRHAESRGGPLSPGTVHLHFRRLKVLCRWMIVRGIWRYSTLRTTDIVEFLSERLATSKQNGELTVINATQSSMRDYVDMLSTMWVYRDHYVASIRLDVHECRDVDDLLSQARENRMWHPVALNDAIPLLRSSIQSLQLTDTIESAVNTIWNERNKWIGLTRKHRSEAARFLMHRVEDAFQEVIKVDSDDCVSEGFADSIRKIVGASLLIILFFTGMRISEVLSLSTDCLTQRTHSDGVAYWYVKGPGAKKKGRERLWVVPDIVVDVVSMLSRLFSQVRERFGIRDLFLSKPSTIQLLTGRVKPTRMRPSAANRMMRETIASLGTAKGDLAFTFHAHRARKTFARFVVMRDKSSLESLAHHYGHVYAATVDRHYVGNDFRLTELIQAEDLNALKDGLLALLSSPRLGGRAGEKMMALRERTVDSPDFRGKVTLEGMVEKLVQDGVILAPCDWGFCVYAREQSKCRGSSTGPNPVLRAPSVCASCSNFAVADRHLPWWERRYADQISFLAAKELPEQTRRIVTQQREASEKIILSMLRKKHHGGER